MARSKSKQSRFEALQKEAVEKALTEAAYVLIKEKAANRGKIPYSAYNRVIREFGCPSLTRHLLRHKIIELEKKKTAGTNQETNPPMELGRSTSTSIALPRRPDDDDVSELTNPSTLASPLTITDSQTRRNGDVSDCGWAAVFQR